jgi:hypothetical protein
MTAYRMQNPVFVAYMIAAAIMILKVMGQGWMTVYRMMKTEMGLLNPEDLLPGPFNRNPDPRQLELNDYVERGRRMQRNDLENIPAFLAAGLLFVAVEPPAALAIALLALFAIARLFTRSSMRLDSGTRSGPLRIPSAPSSSSSWPAMC